MIAQTAHPTPEARLLSVKVSRHARKRAHERAGLNRSAVERTAINAANKGHLVAGTWNDTANGLPPGILDHANVVRFNRFLYFFSPPLKGGTTLITLYQDPFAQN